MSSVQPSTSSASQTPSLSESFSSSYGQLSNSISGHPEAPFKGIAFLRFILLSYAIYFYSKIFDYSFLKYWAIIFLIGSFDIVFEFFIGFNIFGLKSNYIGRIASFTGDELKVGGYYFGFLLLSLSFFYSYNKKIFYPLFILLLILSCWAATLPGAMEGYKTFLLHWDTQELLNPTKKKLFV